MTDRELMQQALEALNLETPVGAYFELKNALRYRIRQPEQEPVAWRYKPKHDGGWGWSFAELKPVDFINYTIEPVYTTPPQRKPLDEIAVFDLADQHLYEGGKNYGILEFARAIEYKHGIKP